MKFLWWFLPALGYGLTRLVQGLAVVLVTSLLWYVMLAPLRSDAQQYLQGFLRDSQGSLFTVQCAVGSTSNCVTPNAAGQQPVAIASPNVTNGSDGVATTSTNIPTVAYNAVFNGSTWDRWRSNGGVGPGVAAVNNCGIQAVPQCQTIDQAASGDAASGSKFAAWVASYNLAFNGTGGWDRLRTSGAFGDSSVGILATSPCTAGNCTFINSSAMASDGNNPHNALYNGAFLSGYNGTTWDRLRKDSYASGPLQITDGGSATATVAAGTGTTVIKASAGRLSHIVITTAGTSGNATCYDNASSGSGTVLAVVPGTTGDTTAFVGKVYALSLPAANGITCVGAASSPAFTISYY